MTAGGANHSRELPAVLGELPPALRTAVILFLLFIDITRVPVILRMSIKIDLIDGQKYKEILPINRIFNTQL